MTYNSGKRISWVDPAFPIDNWSALIFNNSVQPNSFQGRKMELLLDEPIKHDIKPLTPESFPLAYQEAVRRIVREELVAHGVVMPIAEGDTNTFAPQDEHCTEIKN